MLVFFHLCMVLRLSHLFCLWPFLSTKKEQKTNNWQAVFMLWQEKERRKQHVMLIKAVEARKKAEVGPFWHCYNVFCHISGYTVWSFFGLDFVFKCGFWYPAVGEGASEEGKEGWETDEQREEAGAEKTWTGKGQRAEKTPRRSVFSRS